jgi:ankyrin repeat protein
MQERFDAEADPEKKRTLGQNLLEFFRERVKITDNKELTQIILAAPSILDEETADGESGAHILAFKGKSAVLSALRAQLDRNRRDHKDRTALHLAAWSGELETVSQLLDLGFDPGSRDVYGATPLHIAARNKHWPVLDLLLKNYPGLTDVQAANGMTLIHLVAEAGNVDMLKRTLAVTAAIDQKDISGRTALHLAARAGVFESVHYLLESGANRNAIDKFLDTPLHYACEAGSLKVVRDLLTAGAKPSLKDVYDLTPLHLAASEGHSDCCIELVMRGADINDRDSDDETPLHLASREGRVEAVKALVKLGADLSARNKEGQIAEDVARLEGHVEVIQSLQ